MRMVLNTSGNVGIGTTGPNALLSLGEAVSTIKVAAYDGGDSYLFGMGVNAGQLTFGAGIPATGTPQMVLTAAGAVGIGTTSPQQLLDVHGTMAAQEVIVTTSGADYVFDPNYRLAPLSEVAGYIQEHHHLPDIPSSEEMQQKGASVGEMQAKMLAKIEELTLHMIEADKENQELRARIAHLEAAEGRKESK
jgi:hypothetical protein